MTLDPRYTSPGAAFAAQAADEARLERLVEKATGGMLLSIREQAFRNQLLSSTAREAWERAVTQAVTEFGLKPASPEGQMLMQGLMEVNLGEEAYMTASAVMRKASETYPAPSKKEILAALDEALDLDTPSLTAAGALKFISSLLQKMTSIGQIWRTRVKRSVRTSFTGMAGALAMVALRNAGVKTKRWVARRDDKTRETHDHADGQEVPLESRFLVGGAPLLYPGDRSGPIQETANCRCVIVAGRS